MPKLGLILILVGIALPTYSQTHFDGVKVTSDCIIREVDQVTISMNLVLDGMNINQNDMVILTPTLKSNETSSDTLLLPPVVIAGKLRHKIVTRIKNLGNLDKLPFQDTPQTILKRENNTYQSIDYNVSVSYKPWMDNASLVMSEAVSGCANCYNNRENQLVTENILPRAESYKLTCITPKAKIRKAQSNRHIVTFNYPVDSYQLLRDYENNSNEFAKVEEFIKDIRDNKKIEITELTIVGYASPEGRFEYNRKLAENRANSFAQYLATELSVSLDKFNIEGKGEDWEGLYRSVSSSNLTNKLDILNIIDKVKNPDIRDRQLIRLSSGDTYKDLLKNYYPNLRRTEYTIAYILHPIDVEEAKQIIKTNPEQLSLDEIYLVAENYPSNSKEFKELFDIAIQLYPFNEIAIVNTAASDIENKHYDQAIERLNKIEDNPIAWNNLGVAYALKGYTQKASEYFKKSLNNTDAETNLRIIQETNRSH